MKEELKVEIKRYIAQDAIELCGDEKKYGLALFNQASPAYSLFIDGKLVACGGMRIGVGEAWFIMSDDDRDRTPDFTGRKRKILSVCRKQMEELCREHSLWKLYAEPEMSTVFIKALGFTEQPTFVR